MLYPARNSNLYFQWHEKPVCDPPGRKRNVLTKTNMCNCTAKHAKKRCYICQTMQQSNVHLVLKSFRWRWSLHRQKIRSNLRWEYCIEWRVLFPIKDAMGGLVFIYLHVFIIIQKQLVRCLLLFILVYPFLFSKCCELVLCMWRFFCVCVVCI